MKRIAALITFKEGVKKEDAAKLLEKMSMAIELVKGKEEANELEKVKHELHEFDDEKNWPTFYLP